jgi:hypothetical protein
MITADFQVTGKNLDDLSAKAEMTAAELMGDRPYGLDMSITPRLWAEEEATPADWQADVRVRVQHAWTPTQIRNA